MLTLPGISAPTFCGRALFVCRCACDSKRRVSVPQSRDRALLCASVLSPEAVLGHLSLQRGRDGTVSPRGAVVPVVGVLSGGL